MVTSCVTKIFIVTTDVRIEYVTLDGKYKVLSQTATAVQVLKSTKVNNQTLPLIVVVVGALIATGLSFYTHDKKLVQDIVLAVWASFANGFGKVIIEYIKRPDQINFWSFFLIGKR